MTKISNKQTYIHKTPVATDDVFGKDNDNDGDLVRFDMYSLAQLIATINQTSPIQIKSYFPSGW